MLMNIKSLEGYTLEARNGEIGTVKDFYFDEEQWVVRYLVVKTGSFLSRKRVLIGTAAIRKPDWEKETFPVELTKKEVENAPDTDLDKPLSRQYEETLHKYYGWVPYWPPRTFYGYVPYEDEHTVAVGEEDEPELEEKRKETAKEASGFKHPHLRSFNEIEGYELHAEDGQIGHAEDLVIDAPSFSVRYLVVDTRTWLPGKKVLIAPEWIKHICWAEEQVKLAMTMEKVKNSPEYDQGKDITREFEEKMYAYYEYPGYWV